MTTPSHPRTRSSLAEASLHAIRAVDSARASHPSSEALDSVTRGPALKAVVDQSGAATGLDAAVMADALETLAAHVREANGADSQTEAAQNALALIRNGIELATHGTAGLLDSAGIGHSAVLSQINDPAEPDR